MGLQDALDPDELGVARAAEGPVRVVHAPGYDRGVVDEDAADGDFGGGEGEFGLGEGLEHEGLVDCALGGGHLGGGGRGGFFWVLGLPRRVQRGFLGYLANIYNSPTDDSY